MLVLVSFSAPGALLSVRATPKAADRARPEARRMPSGSDAPGGRCWRQWRNRGHPRPCWRSLGSLHREAASLARSWSLRLSGLYIGHGDNHSRPAALAEVSTGRTWGWSSCRVTWTSAEAVARGRCLRASRGAGPRVRPGGCAPHRGRGRCGHAAAAEPALDHVAVMKQRRPGASRRWSRHCWEGVVDRRGRRPKIASRRGRTSGYEDEVFQER